MKKLLLKRQEQYYKNPVENNSKEELPEEIEEIEEKHLRKVLEECRKPGKGILKKLDYYFIPGSLVKREKAYQFFRKGLENQFPEKFEISKLEKKQMRNRMQQAYGTETMRNAAYIIGTMICYFMN